MRREGSASFRRQDTRVRARTSERRPLLADPKVSVVIPVFDGERYLADAIHSVLAQDRFALEVIVVDDGSTDGSAEIAAGFEGVTCLRQENAGPAAARNRGIAAATGSILAFLDGDDVWTPDKLEHQVGHLRKHPAELMTIARFRYFLEPGREVPPAFNRELLGRELLGRLPSTLVARREAFDRVGTFDAALRTGEDVDWFARAKDLGIPPALVPRVLLEKRVHDRNTSLDAANTQRLLQVLSRSIRRQRQADRPEQSRGGEEGGDR